MYLYEREARQTNTDIFNRSRGWLERFLTRIGHWEGSPLVESPYFASMAYQRFAAEEGPGAGLPSYQDAVAARGLGWLELVAPYVLTRDYMSLCLVSHRFYDVFCPRLWKDPLVTMRVLGLDLSNG